ncbi:iron ABC transporter [bacterium]|nr:iron ABC transporter [bacterium]
MWHEMWSTSPAGSAAAIAFWTIVVGCLCAVPASLLGTFLVLRRMSLLGDAISHAVLPGLAIAFLLSGRVSGWPIFLGAVITALLTAFLTRLLSSTGMVNEQAGLGVVFTSLFAIGVILIGRAAENVDLDPGCVLYGAIEFVPLESVRVGPFEWPRTVPSLALTAAITVAFVVLAFKELKISSFDPGLADSMGLSSRRIDFVLLFLTSIVTVLSFEAVGSILVIVLLVAPGCTALLLTDRLAWALFLAVACGCATSATGYSAALATNTSVAGMMAVSGGVLFVIAWAFSPLHGRIAQVLRKLQVDLRIATDDLLAYLFRKEELRGQPDGVEKHDFVRHPILERLALRRAVRKGWIEPGSRNLQGPGRLTPAGREVARSLVRSHRLWESFLHRDFDLPEDHLHEPAELAEHFLGPDLQKELVRELNAPKIDPHGQTIPGTASEK